MAVDGQVQQAEQLLADATDPLSPGVAELRATLLAQLGRREEALAMTDRLLAQRPGQDRLIIERARLLESLDRVNDAERGLLDALTAQPREEVLYAALLDLYERHGELTRNYTWVARRLLANLPQSRLAKFVLAENHEARQDFPQAERLLKEILQEHPGDIQATQLLIEIYLRSERANEAAELAQQIAQRQPRNPEARKVLIRALVLQRDLPAAAEAMEQFTRDFPEDDSVSMQLVQAYAQQERWDDAARHLDALLKRTPDNLRLLNDAAIIYQQAGRKEQALPILDKLINQLPPGLDRDQHRAMALALRNDIGGALGIVREWVATQEAEQATLAASLVWQILEPLPAEEAVDKLIALLDQLPVPSRTPVAFPTSIQLEQRGDGLAAERLLEKLLKDTPDDAMINNSLGYRLAMQGKRLDEAKAMIQKALDAEPENGAYQDSLGWVLYKQGNFQGAEQWLSKALAREPYPVIADHLGDALYRLDRKEQAVQMWQRALTPLDEPIQFPDPELEGLADRLNAKIEAVTNDQPAPVSPMAGE
jgi:predicted Zn-dependent protease